MGASELHALLYALAAGAGILLAWRVPAYRPVAAFVTFMAFETPLRGQDLPLELDRLIVLGWDGVFLAAVTHVTGVGRWIRASVPVAVASVWLQLYFGAPVEVWFLGWHLTAMAMAFGLLLTRRHRSPLLPWGVCALYVGADVYVLLSGALAGDWAHIHLVGTLTAAVVLALELLALGEVAVASPR